MRSPTSRTRGPVFRGLAPVAVTLAVVAAMSSSSAAAVPKPAYTSTPGQSRPNVHFIAKYKGSGSYGTVYHSEPHNQGGADDKNDAHDSSTQSWDVKYRGGVTIPACGDAASGVDPCEEVRGPTQAKGPTLATGRVNHKHVDGLYRSLDRTMKCRLRSRPSRKNWLPAGLGLRYIPGSGSVGVTAYSPLYTATTNFPAQCPNEADPIDGLLNFYAMPGFSFSPDYGPDRWFTSREIVIPSQVLHRATSVRIPLHVTGAGRSPKGCRVGDPSVEHCKTGGSWSGVLTLRRTP